MKEAGQKKKKMNGTYDSMRSLCKILENAKQPTRTAQRSAAAWGLRMGQRGDRADDKGRRDAVVGDTFTIPRRFCWWTCALKPTKPCDLDTYSSVRASFYSVKLFNKKANEKSSPQLRGRVPSGQCGQRASSRADASWTVP